MSSVIVQSCHAAGVPVSDLGELLGVGLCRGEQVATLGDAIDDGPDRPAVGSQVLVVQLVPGDRRRDRGARRGPDRVRRDERLDRRVLGVVESGLALASALRPLPGDELRARSSRRPSRRARPTGWSARSCISGRSGSRSGCRACRSSWDSRARRDAPARSGRGERGRGSPPGSSSRPGRCRCRRRSAATGRAGARSRRGSRSWPGCRASRGPPHGRR